MSTFDILKQRLNNTGLATAPFKDAAQVVAHFGAVQAQEFGPAKWALGLRVKNSTDKDIEEAFNKGQILRTHVMRPTWHFVLPEDISWMLELTASGVRKKIAHFHRQLNFDKKLFDTSNTAISKALRGHTYLTSQELKKVVESAGIKTDALGHINIIMWAELEGLICSGPRRGKQFTYALLEERVPSQQKFIREDALKKLALAYFRSHGPAQVRDFCWWSGLSMKECYAALDSITSRLNQETLNGKTYWASAHQDMKPQQFSRALLLSIYDEYVIAYNDRSDISEARDIERKISAGVRMVIGLDGKVAGAWKRTIKNHKIEVKLDPLWKLGKREIEAIEKEVIKYGEFMGIPAILI